MDISLLVWAVLAAAVLLTWILDVPRPRGEVVDVDAANRRAARLGVTVIAVFIITGVVRMLAGAGTAEAASNISDVETFDAGEFAATVAAPFQVIATVVTAHPLLACLTLVVALAVMVGRRFRVAVASTDPSPADLRGIRSGRIAK